LYVCGNKNPRHTTIHKLGSFDGWATFNPGMNTAASAALGSEQRYDNGDGPPKKKGERKGSPFCVNSLRSG